MKRLTGALRTDMALIALPFMLAAALMPWRGSTGPAQSVSGGAVIASRPSPAPEHTFAATRLAPRHPSSRVITTR